MLTDPLPIEISVPLSPTDTERGNGVERTRQRSDARPRHTQERRRIPFWIRAVVGTITLVDRIGRALIVLLLCAALGYAVISVLSVIAEASVG